MLSGGVTRRAALLVLAASACGAGLGTLALGARPAASRPAEPAGVTLLVTGSRARHVAYVDPNVGAVEQLEVGAAPHCLALAADGRAYVATAEGVAVVDAPARRLLALVPYQTTVGPPRFGEYRPGGMGIAVAPDGRHAYVAVFVASGPSQLEILDTTQLAMVAAIPVGLRPFDVVVSPDGRRVYSIDHDSYSVTVVEPESGATRTVVVAPLGRGAFDKPHYAAVRADGHLLLPFQGRALVDLDPTSGTLAIAPLTADTHQHGVALTPDGQWLLIVGTGPAGGARSGPSLTIVDAATLAERTVLPLARPHERIAVSPDGRTVYLAGGYLLSGWDGITAIDLEQGTTRQVAVPNSPLDIAILV